MSNQKYNIAHVKERGQNMIIIPVDSSFNSYTEEEQKRQYSMFQICATKARLAGTVVLVWEVGSRLGFLAPKEWHPFFRSISMDWVTLRKNTILTC